MRITQNFTFEELIRSTTAENKGIDNTPPIDAKAYLYELVILILQPIRDLYGHPITITSGYRSYALNKAVGGAKTSQHLKGQAADITVGSKEKNKILFELISDMVKEKKIIVGQLIDEKDYSWIHISLPTLKHNNQIIHIK